MINKCVELLAYANLGLNRALQPLVSVLNFDSFVLGLLFVFISYRLLLEPWFSGAGSDRARKRSGDK